MDLDRPQRDILSVTRLVREARAVLEGSFPLLWVQGEISNLSRPASGHLYFSLKDELSQVRCALFRNERLRLRFDPANGQMVLGRVRVSLYEPRGDFQLIVEHLEPAGEGALRQAFEWLKQKLALEGLFDAAHKVPLPRFPRQVGVITSPSGAALRDVLSVLRRRHSGLGVILYPAQVQGAGAVEELIRALRIANQRAECDVLILCRGGGSLEDLMAFNDEGLARALFASRIPVVTGIGHEIDFSIADFVADHRAPTPSAAAELVSPNRAEWLHRLTALDQRGYRAMRLLLHRLESRRQQLDQRLARGHPRQRLQQGSQRLDELERRLANSLSARLHATRVRLEAAAARLAGQQPGARLEHSRRQMRTLHERLILAMARQRQAAQQRLSRNLELINALSPLATLSRGYSLTRLEADHRILRRSDQVAPGDCIRTSLALGSLLSRVEQVYGPEPQDPTAA